MSGPDGPPSGSRPRPPEAGYSLSTLFRSTRPGGYSTVSLVGQAIGAPFGACMLPVMIGALVAMLQGRDALPFLLFGFPAAMAVAWFWTVQRLKGDIMEVEFHGSFVALRSAWEVATGYSAGIGSAVLDIRETQTGLIVTAGLDTHALGRLQFESFDELTRCFKEARRLHLAQVLARLEHPEP